MSSNANQQGFDPEPPDEYYQSFHLSYDSIIPAAHLPEGWEWRLYDDGSGGLYSPDNKEVVDVDFATSEYKHEKGWSFIDGYPYETISSSEFMKNMEKSISEAIGRENMIEEGGHLVMNENVTTTDVGASLMDNEHVKELFSILQENGKDSSGLAALINHVTGMEDFVVQAESKIASMKVQLDEMKELQDHPFKSALLKAITALETKVAEIKAQIVELKTNIVESCKNAVAAFKEKGAAALDKLASFFNIKSGLESVKNSTVKAADGCDRACAKIETFSKNYHTAGRALKNMARMVIGKEPIDAVKESGKLAKAVSAPYKAEKACLVGIRKQCDKMITVLNNLEKKVEVSRGEQADKPKKPTMMERLEAKKNEIKEREREAPAPDRTKKVQAEL